MRKLAASRRGSKCRRDGVAHLSRADFLRGGVGRGINVAGAQAVGDGFADGGVDGVRGGVLFEAVAEHQGGGKNLRDGFFCWSFDT